MAKQKLDVVDTDDKEYNHPDIPTNQDQNTNELQELEDQPRNRIVDYTIFDLEYFSPINSVLEEDDDDRLQRSVQNQLDNDLADQPR
jgi:hypothetical protein